MANVIRLARGGRVHSPIYRISVAESAKAPTGKFLQRIGFYDPNQEPPVVRIDEKSAIEWMIKGALPTDTVKSIFKKQGVLEKYDQVKKGTPFEEATSTVKDWKPKKPKPSKKVLAKAKAETEAKAAEEEAKKAEAAAPKAEATEEAPAEEKTEAAPVEEKAEAAKEEDKPAEG